MDDPFSPSKPFVLANYRVERMVLSPAHWKTFSLGHRLRWTATKFDRANRANVPNDKNGVYSFLVQPGIAKHTACSYLMYVGKAETQSLRERFDQYFDHLTETSRRTNISKMLRLWQGFLWFCFAPVTDQTLIDGTEQALVNAYLPPYNRRYRGVVAKQLRYLFA
jgi:excinuclease UvrABC nuclease subunit